MQSCLCEFCMKIFLYMEGINKFLIKKGHRELTLKNPGSSLDLTLCPRTNANYFHKLQCIERSCRNCGVDLINKYFEPLKNCMDELAEWSIWSKMTDEYVQSDGTLRKVTKWRPVNKEGPFNELVTSMQKDLEKFSLHLFTANWQQQQFADLKQGLPCNWLLLVSDFGQNFTCHHQDEIQGAHWARTEVTIHPVVSYYRDKDLIVKESMFFLSNDLKHDGHASQHFQTKVIYELANRGHAFTKVISFSDGCAAQYKGKLNFVDLSFSKEDTNVSIERHYFGSRHGKGPCDAEIGVVKKNATLAIKRRVAIISDAKGLFLWAKEYMTKAEPTSKRTFFLVEQGEINRDRPDRSNEKIRSLQGSRSVHAVRGITPYNIAYRKRSCFCFPCRNSDGSQCLHDEICGSWKVFKLQKQNVVQSQSNLEASLDVSPICSNSKATLEHAQQSVRQRSRLPINTVILFVPQQEAWVIERFGKFNQILQPGLNFILPVIDGIKYVQSLKEIAIDVPHQAAITLDNVTLTMDAVLYLKVVDPYKASYGVEDPEYAITQLAQTTMRSEIGKIALDTVFRERESLNIAIVDAINHASNAWGIKCMRYEIRDMKLPTKVQEAMQTQVEAERKKRAAILESEGIREAEINVAEGKKKSRILNSEAHRAEQINQAEGEAEAILAKARARAASIELISDALAKENGLNAVSMNIAEQYVKAFSNLAKESNTVVLPVNTNDVSGMVTQALTMYKALSKENSQQLQVKEIKDQNS
ncbi:stomatin-like protein 2 mitochondrial [Biomphalaria pfeifferi]|uniref:Stomatin-like protein 2 mitochondrial n=1 Tax=Biomphalaria pfeifferi TaxID=112525 RepID=A0AAD8F4Z2_BIOPF|nr:stomatin-like protein 2 mitochondrial [Biomphalaria pfeifferi]